MQKVICPECGTKGYALEKSSENFEGEFYIWETPYCPHCGKLLYVDEIQKKNIENKRNAIRKARGLVSYEDLLKLPKRYGISRDFLNLILNLDNYDDAIYVSVWDGEVPTKEESDRIRDAHEPAKFMKMLEAVGDKIPTEKYEKVHRRVRGMIK